MKINAMVSAFFSLFLIITLMNGCSMSSNRISPQEIRSLELSNTGDRYLPSTDHRMKKRGADWISVRPSFFQLKWSLLLENTEKIDSGNLPIGLSSPLVYQSLIYAGSYHGEMTCHDLDSGRKLWSFTEEDAPMVSGAVIYEDQVLYGGVTGRLYSRHYHTGELRYTVDLGSSLDSRLIIHQDRLLVQLRNHSVLVLDAKTGKILWSYKRPIGIMTTIQRQSAPKVFGNMVVVGFADGRVLGLDLRDGTQVWEKMLGVPPKFMDVDTDAVLYQGDQIFMGPVNSNFVLMNAKTGNILREYPFKLSRGPLVLSPTQVLAGTVDGKLILFDPRTGVVEKEKLLVDNRPITSHILYRGHIIVTMAHGQILALDPKTWKIKDRFYLGSPHSAIFGDAEVSDEYMAFISSRNRLYVFGPSLRSLY